LGYTEADYAEAVWTYPTRTLATGTPGPPATDADSFAQAVWGYTPRRPSNPIRIWVPHRWEYKPPLGTPLNIDHPLYGGLWHCVVFNEGAGPPFDLAPGASRATFTGAPTWSLTPGGRGLYCTAGTSADFPDHGNLVAGDFAIRVVHRPRSWANIYNALCWKYSAGYEIGLFFNTAGNLSYIDIGGTFQDRSSTPIVLGMTAGSVWDFVLTRVGSTCTFYVNGRAAGAVTLSGTTGRSAALVMGRAAPTVGSQYDGDYLTLQAWRGRTPTASEVESLYRDSYQLCLPPTSRQMLVGMPGEVAPPSGPTHGTDTALRGATVGAFTTSTLARATTTRAFTTSTLVRATTTQAYATDTRLLANPARGHGADALTLQVRAATHGADARALGARLLGTSVDAALRATATHVHGTDTLTRAGGGVVQYVDALARGTQARTATGDALARATSAHVFTSDAWLRAAAAHAHGADAMARAGGSVVQYVNAGVRGARVLVQAGDARLRASPARGHFASALAKAVKSAGHGADARTLGGTGHVHFAAASARSTRTRGHLGSSLSRRTSMLVQATSSLARRVVARIHGDDSLLRGSPIRSGRADAYLAPGDPPGTHRQGTSICLAHPFNIEAEDLTIGADSVAGHIRWPGDIAWYRFIVVEPGSYAVTVSGIEGPQDPAELVLWLHREEQLPAGHFDERSGPIGNPYIAADLTPGRYVTRVAHREGSAMARFRIRVWQTA
jgi:hypothetical protein